MQLNSTSEASLRKQFLFWHFPPELENPNDFKSSWVNCYKSLPNCAERLKGLLAPALDLPENWFEKFFLNPIIAMRANYYPELVKPPKPCQFRASAYSDYGSLTLLLHEEGESGLEILNRNKEGIKVKPCKPDLVVNIGDPMERWTNGDWVSSLHRVTIPNTKIQQNKSRMCSLFSAT